jgi:hypothetical protein
VAGRTVDVAGKGTSEASDEGDAKGMRDRADTIQVERQGEGKCRRRGQGGSTGGEAEKGEG